MIFGKKPDSTASSTGAADGIDSRQPENTKILSVLAQDYLRERRSKRRWGIFFKLLLLSFVGATAMVYLAENPDVVSDEHGEHTAIIEINGIIGPDGNSARIINRSLGEAFAAKNSAGVVLEINSPGGTPVQAGQINGEINRLRLLYPHKPFYVAITDICASGGYYIAVAAEEIFAHPASIVGSIGVLINGFGFVGTMNKLGVERRLITAGDNKGILDPFSPMDETQVRHAQSVLADVHDQFIDAVKRGRGNKLADDPEIFSGLFWSGEKAIKLGLIDQFGTVEDIARDIVGVEKTVDYTFRPTVFNRFAEQFGASVSNTFMRQLFRIQ